MSRIFRRPGERQRHGTPADLLIVGLGNPGQEFAGTRHNVGADCVAVLALRHGKKLAKASKERALTAEVVVDGKRVVLALPQTFMNNSGESVRLLTRRYGIEMGEQILVVHDELDLDVGRLKLKQGGGMAGHNGLKSITQHIGTTDFNRLRIGVGKPPPAQAGRDFVLRRPSKADRKNLDDSVEAGAEAAEMFIASGIEPAMAVVNRRS